MTSIGNSLQNDKFQAIITKRVREREDHPLNSQNLTIGSRQGNIFQESSMVLGMQACIYIMFMQMGRSYHLLRKAIHRIKILRKEKTLKNRRLLESIPNLHDQIEDLKEQLFWKKRGDKAI